ncbi:MAG: MCE family protein [Mycolicibacterium hassiacum]|uniref:MCE family protein n=1 Tax=Mycolicibacterium hassiacum TaxID=46351 RepID=UPI000DB8E1B9|nr:MCE family protein [Mycolicibacterium hassiacum]MBX5489061.1 MCE family protein [Mycolicibacterium hassiacum]PZN21175.1 MAG: mammalian cell entry protein [Mycolicibacterium hassiacum]
MSLRRTALKVGIFTAVMLLMLAGLVLTFGQFRFGSTHTYHADFTSVSRLKTGQDVRIAGIPVGKVKSIAINGDHATVTFTVDKRQQLYTSTRAAIRYQNLTGDRYLEIFGGPGELRSLPPGGTIPRENTQPAVDLDALLGGFRPVLKGLDGAKVNEISNAIIELLQDKGATLADVLANTAEFTHTIADRDRLIDETIDNLTTVLAAAAEKSDDLAVSVGKLQQLITELSMGRDPIVNALEPLATTERELTEVLGAARRPIQAVLETAGPLAAALDERKADLNASLEPLAEDYLRLSALGAYGSFFNIYFCSVKIKINGPAGSDIIIPAVKPPQSNNGRCDFAK